MALLPEIYPPKKYSVKEETDTTRALKEFESKSVVNWGAGRIPGTEYHQLAICSPEHKGDKQFVLICKSSLLGL